jgi:hypothetical protein
LKVKEEEEEEEEESNANIGFNDYTHMNEVI